MGRQECLEACPATFLVFAARIECAAPIRLVPADVATRSFFCATQGCLSEALISIEARGAQQRRNQEALGRRRSAPIRCQHALSLQSASAHHEHIPALGGHAFGACIFDRTREGLQRLTLRHGIALGPSAAFSVQVLREAPRIEGCLRQGIERFHRGGTRIRPSDALFHLQQRPRHGFGLARPAHHIVRALDKVRVHLKAGMVLPFTPSRARKGELGREDVLGLRQAVTAQRLGALQSRGQRLAKAMRRRSTCDQLQRVLLLDDGARTQIHPGLVVGHEAVLARLDHGVAAVRSTRTRKQSELASLRQSLDA